MRWPFLHNVLQRHTERYSFTKFIIIDQFYRLRNMSRRRLIQMDICDKKLFPQFFILSFILLVAVESINMEQCLLATVAIQQMLDEWIICLKCHKTVICLVVPYYLQDSEALVVQVIWPWTRWAASLLQTCPCMYTGASSHSPLSCSCHSPLYLLLLGKWRGVSAWGEGRWLYGWGQETQCNMAKFKVNYFEGKWDSQYVLMMKQLLAFVLYMLIVRESKEMTLEMSHL